jgi:hypothetical protein
MIFITDDSKVDWWLFDGNNIVSPRPELLHEMKSESGAPFYMYRTDTFLKHSRTHLEQEVNQETINEVKGSLDTDLSAARRTAAGYLAQQEVAAKMFGKMLGLQELTSKFHEIQNMSKKMMANIDFDEFSKIQRLAEDISSNTSQFRDSLGTQRTLFDKPSGTPRQSDLFDEETPNEDDEAGETT